MSNEKGKPPKMDLPLL